MVGASDQNGYIRLTLVESGRMYSHLLCCLLVAN